jgi:hypothetical protein
MRDEATDRVRHLVARIGMWSLVSLPAFWVPMYYDYRYPISDSRLGMLIPFLAIAGIVSIHALIQLQRVLRSRSWSRRCLLTAPALLLSAPTLAPIAFIVVRLTAHLL